VKSFLQGVAGGIAMIALPVLVIFKLLDTNLLHAFIGMGVVAAILANSVHPKRGGE
jgi:hypothetical protein